MRSSLLLALAPLAACNLQELADDVKGVTNPLIAEGIMLGVAPPESEDIDLSGTEFAQNAAAGVMLADAKGVDDMADAPVSGAEVAVLSDVLGRVDFGEDSAGAYSADSGDGLDYVEGDQVVLSMTIEGEASKITSRLPPAPNTAGLPDGGQQGVGFTVDLSAQDFENVLVIVIDGQSGEVTFDNRPADIKAVYELTHGEGDKVIEVPGSAVPGESVYLLGVAGLKNADADDMDNVNTALSAFLTGRMAFTAYNTLPVP